jgi:Domain of unknown function (DUF1844)
MSEDQGFEVVDKRRVRADAEETAPPAEEGASQAGEAEAGAAAEPGPGAGGASGQAGPGTGAAGQGTAAASPGVGTGEKLPPVKAADVVAICIGQLHEIAWAQMGLVPNPVSQTIERDLADARLAIDCIADLARHLEKAGDPAMQRELQTMLSNLRLNFVQQSQKG